MKEYEEKPVTKTEKVLIKTTCDICGKEIIADNKDGHYTISRHHHDWGNDSIESYEDKDICSDECLVKELEDYINCTDTTKCIEIEKVY